MFHIYSESETRELGDKAGPAQAASPMLLLLGLLETYSISPPSLFLICAFLLLV